LASQGEAGYVWINNNARPHVQPGLGREDCLDELESYARVKSVNVSLES